jgi:hypothetical protein
MPSLCCERRLKAVVCQFRNRYREFESIPLRQIAAPFGIDHRGQASLETPWLARVGWQCGQSGVINYGMGTGRYPLTEE